MHMGHQGYPDLIDDHLLKRGLGDVWIFPNRTVRWFWYIWNYQSIDKRETEKFHGDPKVVRRVLE
jgi:hypothetical protein